MIPLRPTVTPIFAMSFVFTKTVLYAKAFGGVLIGKLIAREQLKATATNKPCIPPKESKPAPMLIPNAAIIGANKLVAAVLLINVLIKMAIKAAPIKIASAGQEAKGIDANKCSARPVF